jgi:hypothetical protein
MGRTVGVVLKAFDFGGNPVLVVAPKVNHPVMLLVPTTAMTRRDVTIVVAPSGAVLRFDQSGMGGAFVQPHGNHLDEPTAPWRSRLNFYDGHFI